MSDVSKQECIDNKRTPQRTKMRISFSISNSDDEQKSQIYSYNRWGRLQNPQYMKMVIHIGFINENAICMKFYVIIPGIPSFIQLA